jgi:hypothetical protein
MEIAQINKMLQRKHNSMKFLIALILPLSDQLFSLYIIHQAAEHY